MTQAFNPVYLDYQGPKHPNISILFQNGNLFYKVFGEPVLAKNNAFLIIKVDLP